jgi:hypothetical protein
LKPYISARSRGVDRTSILAFRVRDPGFKSRREHQTRSSVHLPISLKGVTPTSNGDIYKTDQIYASALERLRSSKEVSNEDKTSILSLVDHMIAKGNGRLRAVKYINHLTVTARMAGKPLGQLDKQDVEKLVSRINTSDYKDSTSETTRSY